jgi:S1-C subfamily serine protease
MNRNTLRFCIFMAHFLLLSPAFADVVRVPVSAPIDTESAGRGGNIAINAVVRLICRENNTSGTGFLHRSGNIITADHVVRDCKNPEFVLPNGALAPAATIASDQDHDLAMLKPSAPLSAKPFSLATKKDFKVGTQVSTWGYPGGYYGLSPLLSVGYLSGIDAIQKPPGVVVRQWIVNAAFNGGNSGGPLLEIETGEVFGVVSSKLAPISREAAEILSVLEHQGSGFMYSGKTATGETVQFSEAQLVSRVLTELRNQVQLVIGEAVTLDDLTDFLKKNGVDP